MQFSNHRWICVDRNRVRLGDRWRSIVPWTPPDGKRLPSSDVTSLLGARDGSLWIGMGRWPEHWEIGLTTYLIEPTRINSIIEIEMEQSGSCVAD